MKIYFDNLIPNQSNLSEHERTKDTDYWIIAPGAPIKGIIMDMGYDVGTIDSVDQPGLYWVDVRGDPNWWAGVLRGKGVPTRHVLHCLPQSTLHMVRSRMIRIVIAADREGGPMVSDDWDCFQSTTVAMRELAMPSGSVIIAQGNEKIERQYRAWLAEHSASPAFDTIYSNHFGHIFLDDSIPNSPVIEEAIANPDSRDYNSLNRIYRPQRGAHLYRLAKDGILDKGIVSANQIEILDGTAIRLAKTNQLSYALVMKKNYPKFIDGDWSKINAANQYNVDVYRNSLLSVITETAFMEDVSFVTEKIFKPITMGHPLILFASEGTLRSLRDMGFRTDWCGIDPAYNDETDAERRFSLTQQAVMDWVNLSRTEKIERISSSMDTIIHNFEHIRKVDFYREAIKQMVARSEEYFNETV